MNRTQLIVAIAVAFVVGSSMGLAAGVLVSRFAPPFGPGHGPGREGGPREVRREMLVTRLARSLDLEPGQRQRIDLVLQNARLEHAAVRESMKVGIERELTPEQLARWKQIESRIPSSVRRGGPPPPPDADRP